MSVSGAFQLAPTVTSLGGGNRTFVVDFANLTSCTQRCVPFVSNFCRHSPCCVAWPDPAWASGVLDGARRLTGNAGGGTVKLRVANCDDAHAGLPSLFCCLLPTPR